MDKFKNILVVIFTQIFIYIVLFFGFSFLWQNLKIDNNIAFLIVNILAIAIYIAIYRKINFKFYYWLGGVFPMWFLTTIYHPHDLFGISNKSNLDFTSASTDGFIFSICLLLIQYLIYFLINKKKEN